MSRRKRRCAARKCTMTVNPAALMCHDHWAMVPTPIKREVSAAYRERGGYPSAPMTQRYARALVAAVNAVTPVEAVYDPSINGEDMIGDATPSASIGAEWLLGETQLDDDTPIGSDQPPIIIDDPNTEPPTPEQIERLQRWYDKTMKFGERYGGAPILTKALDVAAMLDVTAAFDWRKHMKADFIILQETTPCHMRVIATEQNEPSTIAVTFACDPCGIRREQTFEINSCDTCNARGGTLSGETQGDPDSGRTGYVEWFEVCDDCLVLGLCPGCSNATLYQGVYEAAMDDIDTFTCEICGWHYEAERFYADEPDYDMNDYRAEVDNRPDNDPDFEGYPSSNQ